MEHERSTGQKNKWEIKTLSCSTLISLIFTNFTNGNAKCRMRSVKKEGGRAGEKTFHFDLLLVALISFCLL
jgi:hypothetical protein